MVYILGIWQSTALGGGYMSTLKNNVQFSKKKNDAQRNHRRRQRYLRDGSIRHFDSCEDSPDLISLLHEREYDSLRMSQLSFDSTVFE